ncbi:MAG TPA: DUF6644 family protein [Candidatus Acidoferrales bacterium]|nr:DUF6644 family protein [Candidatus Acidoferrales bacterium]
MNLLNLCRWLNDTSFSAWLREAPYPFPALIIVHVVSIAVFGGMVVMGNLRVLGWAMRSVPVSQVIEQFKPWKWTAFGILLVTGTLLAASDPLEYCGNIVFWISVGLLLIAGVNAMVFRFGVYRSVAAWDETSAAPVNARRWASVSLFLWIALVFAGRAIAFF